MHELGIFEKKTLIFASFFSLLFTEFKTHKAAVQPKMHF